MRENRRRRLQQHIPPSRAGEGRRLQQETRPTATTGGIPAASRSIHAASNSIPAASRPGPTTHTHRTDPSPSAPPRQQEDNPLTITYRPDSSSPPALYVSLDQLAAAARNMQLVFPSHYVGYWH